jgi:CheY-like chemotaxis protein
MTRRERIGGFSETVDMTTQRILVVDDEEDLLELVRYNLSKEGYQVRCVATGEAALSEVGSFVPDVSFACCSFSRASRAGPFREARLSTR